jgi:tRNA(Ile)-lysidine synthase
LDKLIIKVTKTIEKYKMIQYGDKIVVAVSGGPDSICLIDILNHIKKRFKLSLIVAHVNHGIRYRESDIEERFVRLKSFHMNLPFEQLSVSVPAIARERGLSVEQAGRALRYQFLKDLLQKHQAHKIALGHHMDDQVETILMRIIRGSGLQGLRGIPATRDYFIRPLIDCSRREIEAYCHRRKITYCVDSSNCDPIYLRNKIRHQLIPLLTRQYNPSIAEHLLQLQTIVQDEIDFWEEIVKKYYLKAIIKEYPSGMVLDVKKIRGWPVALQRRVIRRGLGHLREHLADIQFNHVESIRQLCLIDHGEKYLDLPGKIRIRKSYQNLEIGYADHFKKIAKAKDKKYNTWEYLLPICVDKDYPQIGIKIITKRHGYAQSVHEKYINSTKRDYIYVDYDKLVLPLKIRNRRPGDRFVPLNSKFFKKIKSYFIDQKIPLHERDKITVMVDNTDRIVWIIGFQIDDRFKVTKQTKRVLYIQKKNIKYLVDIQ